ncbi:MAG: lamin tail domain-containing protein [Candidatus Latescibacteria bacterium]|nr:lamin tail domain-containing protein [Candidatus Latescibacterota bacterium]
MRPLKIALTAALLLGLAGAAAAQSTCLYFSEYIEGTSNNKALEIYNATEADVNLAQVTVELYFNGAVTPAATVALSGVLHNGDVFVIGHSLASTPITSQADLLINGGVVNFNGDDAVVLKLNGAVVDCIGQVGIDPGTAWGSEPCTTVNHTLTRGVDVCCGDTVTNDAFAPTATWVCSAVDTFGLLGVHASNCQAVATDEATWGAVKSIYR